MQRITLLLTMLLSGLSAFCQPVLTHLQTENLSNPLCLDSKAPRLSWQLLSSDRNELQTAYEIRVSERSDNKDPFWNSGKVTSGQSVQVVYTGPELRSAKRYYWQVRIWDNKGRVSAWSARRVSTSPKHPSASGA